MSKLNMMQLRDVCRTEKGSIISGPFGSNISRKFFVDKGIPVIRGNNLKLGMTRFIDDGFVFVTEEKAKQLNTYARKNDIIFTAAGTIGQVGIIPTEAKYDKYVISNKQLRATIDETKANPLYVFYWLSQPSMERYIINLNTGSTIPLINLSIIKALPIPVPSLEVQNKIVHILDTIDTKIKTNEEINKNLLEQAQSIFTQEFFSFDSIPSGWQKGSLLDIADYVNGLAMQKYRPKDDEKGLPVLKIKELRQGCCDSSSELCSSSIKPEYIVHDGDVVFSWSGSLLVDFWCGGTCGLNQHLFRVSSSVYDKWFYYAWTNHYLQNFVAIAADKATTMGHIKRGELSKAEVLIPSTSDYERIGGLMEPLYNLVIANRIENRKLARLRDELLPQLMSGKIDVSEMLP